jgi:hypothetical protein
MRTMTDRDRLVELIEDRLPKRIETFFRKDIEDIADYLLANGVIVPPCKVGDSIFRVCDGEIWEWIIAMAYVHPEETIYVDDSENEFGVEDIGKTVFLTKSQAEEALKNEQEKL